MTTMRINGVAIRRNSEYFVLTMYDHDHLGPKGSIISQHRTRSAAERALDRTCGFGGVYSLQDVLDMFPEGETELTTYPSSFVCYAHVYDTPDC